MKFAILAAICLAAAAQDGKLIFQKTFPGSTPEFVRITVERSGAANYAEAPDDPQPISLQLTEAETGAMYQLAEKLGWFSRPLESGLPVAKMGDKILRYESPGKTQEQKFNYSTDVDAQALTDWFERITESERYLIELERSARFDKLGTNRILLQIQAAWDRRRLVGLNQYLKWLDRITRNESYMNMARERAAMLADVFRNPPPAEPEKK